MDDEEYIRELMGSFLEMLEIEADFANDGQEAIEKYKLSLEQKRPFDAIIMDLTVRGGMGGREATAEILKLNPQAKVIVSSGYSTDGTLANYQEQGFIARLNKPFTLEELNNILIEVLSSKNLWKNRGFSNPVNLGIPACAGMKFLMIFSKFSSN